MDSLRTSDQVFSSLRQVKQKVGNIVQEIEQTALPQSKQNDIKALHQRKIFWGVQKIISILDGVLEDSLDEGIIGQESLYGTETSQPNYPNDNLPTPSEFCYFMEDAKKSPVLDKMLSVAGVLAIKEYVANSNVYKCYVQANILDSVGNDQWSVGAHNPVFCYEDTPFPSWRKEITLRLSGKSMGTTNVYFAPPDGGRRLRTRDELNSYLLKNNLSLALASKFEFNTTYCVCQSKEDKSCTYIECSFGKGGCNGWLHARCVGIGDCDLATLDNMPSVICPFCAAYLKGSGQIQQYGPATIILDKLTIGQPVQYTEIAGVSIEESCNPHVHWGVFQNGDRVIVKDTVREFELTSFDEEESGSLEAIQYDENIEEDSAQLQLQRQPQQIHEQQPVAGSLLERLLNLCSEEVDDMTIHCEEESIRREGSLLSQFCEGVSEVQTYDSERRRGGGSSMDKENNGDLSSVFKQHELFRNAYSQDAVDAHIFHFSGDRKRSGATREVSSDLGGDVCAAASRPTVTKKNTLSAPADSRSHGNKATSNSKTATVTATIGKNTNSVGPTHHGKKKTKYEIDSKIESPSLARNVFNSSVELGECLGSQGQENEDLIVADKNIPNAAATASAASASLPSGTDASPAAMLRAKILRQAAERVAVPNMSIGLRYKRNIIESSLAIAAKVSHAVINKKSNVTTTGKLVSPIHWMSAADRRSSTNNLSSSDFAQHSSFSFRSRNNSHPIGNGNGNGGGSSSSLRDLELQDIASYIQSVLQTYRMQPVLSMLPCEDGGLRLACVAMARSPKSLHALCCNDFMCAYCLMVFTAEEICDERRTRLQRKVNSKAAAATKRKKGEHDSAFGGSAGGGGGRVIRVRVSEDSSVSYSLHKHCEFALIQKLHEKIETFAGISTCRINEGALVQSAEVITAGDIYPCTDDRDDGSLCDLCGRSGGIMMNFKINAGYSSLGPSSKLGWLAHLPCIQFLLRSRLLVPYCQIALTEQAMIDTCATLTEVAAPAKMSDVLKLDLQPQHSRHSAARETCNHKKELKPGDRKQGHEKNQAAAAFSSACEQASELTKSGKNDNDHSNYSASVPFSTLAQIDHLSRGIVDTVPMQPLKNDDNANMSNVSKRDVTLGSFSTAISPFDVLLNKWRCVLCSGHKGVATRCAALGCTVRAHLLCVTVAGGEWKVIDGYGVRVARRRGGDVPVVGEVSSLEGAAESTDAHSTGCADQAFMSTIQCDTATCFLCSAHSLPVPVL